MLPARELLDVPTRDAVESNPGVERPPRNPRLHEIHYDAVSRPVPDPPRIGPLARYGPARSEPEEVHGSTDGVRDCRPCCLDGSTAVHGGHDVANHGRTGRGLRGRRKASVRTCRSGVTRTLQPSAET